MNTFAAVDLGASSGRVITGRLSDGRLLTEEVSRFPNRPVPVRTAAGVTLHWDILRLYGGVLDGLRAAARRGPLMAVGIDSWAVDYGLLDADGALLGNPVHYRDDRTAGVPDRVFARIPAPELYAHTGLQVQPFNTLFQLAAADGTAQLAAARRLLLIPDLLGYWLTGAEIAEVTNASTTGLLDVHTRTWSAHVLAAMERELGIPAAGLLPPLVEPGTVVGEVDGVMLPTAGARPRLVAVGTHDTASAVAAVPAVEPGFAYISCGTWSLVGLELDAPVISEESRGANFTNELGLDGSVRYLRNVMGLWLLQESVRTWREAGDDVDLATLLAEAAGVPALHCVIDVDASEFLPPGDMPARIAAVVARSGRAPLRTRAEITRCILDSLALAYRRAVREAAELAGREVSVVHVVGGGVRNELLCQLTADATGLPVVAGPVEGAALGNLLVQARAVGVLGGGLPELRAVVAASTEQRRYVPTGSVAAWDRAEAELAP